MDDSISKSYGRALADGISEWELRSGLWQHPFWGVVRPAGVDELNPAVRITDAVALMGPGDVLTGWAAAYLHGVRMLDGLDRWFRPFPISVISTGKGQHRPQAGLHPTRRSIHPHEITEVQGVAVATLTRAAYDLALDASNLCDALVAVDMCISTVVKQARTTRANIERLVAQHAKTKGIVKARKAIELSSPRSASPWETRTRWVAHQADIKGLELNVPIFDLDGKLAGIVDLLDRRSNFVIESDGAGHREEVAHSGDNSREEVVEMLGLFVSRVTAVDHRNRQVLVSRLLSARRHSRMRNVPQLWTTDKPDWWWNWPPGRRWD